MSEDIAWTIVIILVSVLLYILYKMKKMKELLYLLQKEEERKFINKDPLDLYDVIIDINTIKYLGKNGWNILRTTKRKVDETKGKITIGIIGNRNKGKSFILQKLSNQILQSGSMVNTKGLSLKYYDKYVLLDSAGFESPILVDEINGLENEQEAKDKIRDLSRDKLFTEYFLQNYIIEYSNILIVVFGILTLSEQKLLIRLKKTYLEILKKNRHKKLIIIHNLQTYETKEEVKKYIQDILLKSATFKVTLSKQIFVKEDVSFLHDVDNPTIIHLIFAKEGSEAGNFYNESSISAIKTIHRMNVYDNTYDYVETLKTYFINESKKYFELSNEERLELYEDKTQGQNRILKCKKFVKDEPQEINQENELILKRFIINELGDSSFKNNGFEPKYSYYVSNDDDIIIDVECPGQTEIKAEIIGNQFNYIEITGRRNYEIPNNCKIVGIEREKGNFTILIQTEYILEESDKEDIPCKDGIKTFIFHIFTGKKKGK